MSAHRQDLSWCEEGGVIFRTVGERDYYMCLAETEKRKIWKQMTKEQWVAHVYNAL